MLRTADSQQIEMLQSTDKQVTVHDNETWQTQVATTRTI